MSDVSVTVQDSTSVDVTVSGSTSVSVSSAAVGSVGVTEKGPKGDTGATGAQGPQGIAGTGVPSGGDKYELLRKINADDHNTEWAFADRVTIEVRFDEAVSKGDPVYVSGYNNGQDRITVGKADASDSSKMPSIGLATANYSQNDNGQATCIGSLEDVNTQVSPNDFQEGDVLYVKAGGGLTNVKPTGTNLIQNVGKVGRRQQNNGEIVVMAIGRSNDVPNIPNGQAWIGNSSGVATPTTLADVATSGAYSDISGTPSLAAVATSGSASDLSGGTLPVSRGGTGLNTITDNAILFGNGTGAIDSSSNLTYDGAIFQISDGDYQQPSFILKNTHVSGSPPLILFQQLRTSGGGADNQQIGLIKFEGYNTSFEQQLYAQIVARIDESQDGQEGGSLEFWVSTHNGGLGQGLLLEEGSLAAEVDASIGNGGSSRTTVSGELFVGGDVTASTAYIKTKEDKNLEIRSDKTVSVKIDADNDGAELFKVVGYSNGEVFSANESSEVKARKYVGQAVDFHTLRASSATDGQAEGTVLRTGDDTTEAGKLYVMNASGTWVKAKADSESTTKGLLGVALGTNSTDDGMLIMGAMNSAFNISVSPGTVLYISASNAGSFSSTAPSSGNFARIVGYKIAQSGLDVLFNPSQDYIEVA